MNIFKTSEILSVHVSRLALAVMNEFQRVVMNVYKYASKILSEIASSDFVLASGLA